MKTKILILITLASVLCTTCREEEEKDKREYFQIEELETSTFKNCTCSFTDEQFLLVIRNNETFVTECYCSLPEIDFAKYSVIGFFRIFGGLREPIYNYSFYKENDNYIMEITVTEIGYYPWERFGIEKWYLVPKLADNEDVTLKLNILVSDYFEK